MPWTTQAHVLVVDPDGTTHHRLVPLQHKKAILNDARTTMAQLFPGQRYEIHWETAFGIAWAVVFVAPRSTTRP